MDFFAHQDAAKRRTKLLLFYYILAIAILVLLTHVAIIGIFILPRMLLEEFESKAYVEHFYRLDIFWPVAACVSLVVAIGSIIKIFSLRKGGASVAQALGGRELDRSSLQSHERRLINIIEEIAIASGTPLPRIFLLDYEEGINAFAAGYTINDAVIGVTKGCIEKLSRDELQGVIAHEFSHILNSDMRLNIRLIGVLNGILGIYVIGQTLLRGFTSGTRRSHLNRRGGSGGLPIALFAISLVAIGSVGAMFARLIQSAVSRQREYLADSSAVQFTRNPNGIADALKRIAGYEMGSWVASSHAAEVSHMFFSEGLSGFLAKLLSTHPPLSTRIFRLDPNFKGEFLKTDLDLSIDTEMEALSSHVSAPRTEVSHIKISPQDVISSVGTIPKESISRVQELIWALPESIKAATNDLEGSQAIIYCLMLSFDYDIRAQQIELISKMIDNAILTKVLEFEANFVSIKAPQRLPLLDMAVASLRKLSKTEYIKFNELLTQLVQFDKHVSLFEFVTITIIHHAVERQIFSRMPIKVKSRSLDSILKEAAVLLSAIANTGQDRAIFAEQCFEAGLEELAAKYGASYLPPSLCDFKLLNQALDFLNEITPDLKRRLIAACVRTMSHDGKIAVAEAELLRAICESLECPLPVFGT